MKIIDLLNKIANGEIKLGTKFNWYYGLYGMELIFTKRQGALGLYFQEEDRLIELFERYNYQILNDEVEIIEDKKIENIGYQMNGDGTFYLNHKKYNSEPINILARKINELIDAVNELKKGE